MAYSSFASSPTAQGFQGGQNQPSQEIQQTQQRSNLWKPPISSQRTRPERTSAPSYSAQQQPQSSGSPVSATGLIQPATSGASAPAQQPQRAQAPPSTPPPTSPDPFAAMGGGVWTGQGWVPSNHPMAAQYQGTGGQTQPGAPAPTAPMSPYGQYPQRPQGTTYQPGQLPNFTFQNYQPTAGPQPVGPYQYRDPNLQPYQFANPNLPGYQAGQISQFQAPNQAATEQMQLEAMQRILQSGGPLGPDVVNQMKASQKEGILDMSGQLKDQMTQDAARRGVSLGGAHAAREAQLGEATMGDISGAYRDLDIQAALNNQQAQLAALGVSNDILSGQAGRAMDFYDTRLRGEMSQESLNQHAAADALARAQFGLGRDQAVAGNQLATAQFGLDWDRAQAGEYADAFGRDLAASQFDAAQNQFGYQSQFDAPNFAMQRALNQEGLNQAGAGSMADAYNTDLGAYFDWLDSQQANRALDIDNRQLDIQRELGQGGLDIDRSRLSQQGSQFDRGLQLDWARFMNDALMGRYGLGLDYAQLQLAGQNNLMNWMSGYQR